MVISKVKPLLFLLSRFYFSSRNYATHPEEATYSGERFLVQTEDGISCAIVSNEDLKVLEEVDP
jgi:hypothetical protein